MSKKHDIEKALKAVRQNQYYKILTKRKYRHCSEYVDYNQVMNYLSAYLIPDWVRKSFAARDFAHNQIVHSAWLCLQNPFFPVYAVTKDLVNALLETDLPPHVGELKKSFDIALILLPKEMQLFKNPDGGYCQWLLLTHFLPEDENRLYSSAYQNFLSELAGVNLLSTSDSENFNKHKIRWVSDLHRTHHAYASVVGVGDGSLLHGGFKFAAQASSMKEEKEFVNRVCHLAAQLLLYLQTPSSEKRLGDNSSDNNKSLRPSFNSAAPPQDYILLGKNYQ